MRDYSVKPEVSKEDFFAYVNGKKIRLSIWPSGEFFIPRSQQEGDIYGEHYEVDGTVNLFYWSVEDGFDGRWSLIDPVPIISEKSKEIVAGLREDTRPGYYKPEGIEVWDFILSNNIPFIEGNIIKYAVRWRNKNGIEDLRKAQAYLNKLIETEERA